MTDAPEHITPSKDAPPYCRADVEIATHRIYSTDQAAFTLDERVGHLRAADQLYVATFEAERLLRHLIEYGVVKLQPEDQGVLPTLQRAIDKARDQNEGLSEYCDYCDCRLDHPRYCHTCGHDQEGGND